MRAVRRGFLLGLVLLCSFSACRHEGNEYRAPAFSTESSDSDLPFLSSSDGHYQSNSFYRSCLAEHEGYPYAVAYCNQMVEAARPGQLPPCGSYYAWFSGACNPGAAQPVPSAPVPAPVPSRPPVEPRQGMPDGGVPPSDEPSHPPSRDSSTDPSPAKSI